MLGKIQPGNYNLVMDAWPGCDRRWVCIATGQSALAKIPLLQISSVSSTWSVVYRLFV